MHEKLEELEKRVAKLEDMVQAIIDQMNAMVEAMQLISRGSDGDLNVYYLKLETADGKIVEKDVVAHDLDKLKCAIYRAFPGCKILDLRINSYKEVPKVIKKHRIDIALLSVYSDDKKYKIYGYNGLYKAPNGMIRYVQGVYRSEDSSKWISNIYNLYMVLRILKGLDKPQKTAETKHVCDIYVSNRMIYDEMTSGVFTKDTEVDRLVKAIKFEIGCRFDEVSWHLVDENQKLLEEVQKLIDDPQRNKVMYSIDLELQNFFDDSDKMSTQVSVTH